MSELQRSQIWEVGILGAVNKERKGPKLNALERFYICDLTKKGLQLNDACTDMYNSIFDVLVQTNSHTTLHPTITHNTNSQQYTINYINKCTTLILTVNRVHCTRIPPRTWRMAHKISQHAM
jgi:hypothetical protein